MAANRFTGASGSDWFDPSNWSLGVVPASGDPVDLFGVVSADATSAGVAGLAIDLSGSFTTVGLIGSGLYLAAFDLNADQLGTPSDPVTITVTADNGADSNAGIALNALYGSIDLDPGQHLVVGTHDGTINGDITIAAGANLDVVGYADSTVFTIPGPPLVLNGLVSVQGGTFDVQLRRSDRHRFDRDLERRHLRHRRQPVRPRRPDHRRHLRPRRRHPRRHRPAGGLCRHHQRLRPRRHDPRLRQDQRLRPPRHDLRRRHADHHRPRRPAAAELRLRRRLRPGRLPDLPDRPVHRPDHLRPDRHLDRRQRRQLVRSRQLEHRRNPHRRHRRQDLWRQRPQRLQRPPARRHPRSQRLLRPARRHHRHVRRTRRHHRHRQQRHREPPPGSPSTRSTAPSWSQPARRSPPSPAPPACRSTAA